MAETAKYVTAEGFVQFDPIVREANGKTVTDVTLKTPGGEGVLVRVSIWEEIEVPFELEKGDWVAVDGKFSINTWDDKDTGAKRSQPQISAYSLVALKGVKKAEREVVSKSAF